MNHVAPIIIFEYYLPQMLVSFNLLLEYKTL